MKRINRPPKICLGCGKEFIADRRQCVKRQLSQTTCSWACADKVRTKPLEERFWPKVAKGGPDDCWLWLAATDSNGYGRIGDDGGSQRTEEATHASWKLHTGECVPVGMFLCHTCDNPPCVNPNHLFIGTPKDNHDDMRNKKRHSNPPTRYGEANNQTKIPSSVVQAIRIEGQHVPKTGRMKFWAELAAKYNAHPRFVQRLCTQPDKYRRMN